MPSRRFSTLTGWFASSFPKFALSPPCSPIGMPFRVLGLDGSTSWLYFVASLPCTVSVTLHSSLQLLPGPNPDSMRLTHRARLTVANLSDQDSRFLLGDLCPHAHHMRLGINRSTLLTTLDRAIGAALPIAALTPEGARMPWAQGSRAIPTPMLLTPAT